MTRIAIALLVCVLGQVAAADESEQFLKYFSWWEGSWDVEVKEGGEVIKFPMEITRHEPNCHLVKGGGTSLWGYDPKRKKWVGTGFDRKGGFVTTVLERHAGSEIKPGDVNRASSTTKTIEGKVEKAQETWSYLDDKTCKTVVETTTADGNKTSHEYTCTRRN